MFRRHPTLATPAAKYPPGPADRERAGVVPVTGIGGVSRWRVGAPSRGTGSRGACGGRTLVSVSTDPRQETAAV
ncbi:MAG: hypothetical protein ACRDRN_24270, partial [Sciscionella sp.]